MLRDPADGVAVARTFTTPSTFCYPTDRTGQWRPDHNGDLIVQLAKEQARWGDQGSRGRRGALPVSDGSDGEAADGLQELIYLERLSHTGGRTDLRRQGGHIVRRGDQHDWRMATRTLPVPPRELCSGQLRYPVSQDDHIREKLTGEIERIEAICGDGHVQARLHQGLAYHLGDILVAFQDQRSCGRARAIPSI
jgi:hypothetical protein